MKIRFLLIIIFLNIGNVIAQDLFVKQTNFASAGLINGKVNSIILPSGEIISAANYSDLQSKKYIIIHHYSACGDIIWSKSIEHLENLILVDVQLDSSGNSIIAGFLNSNSTNQVPFIISMKSSGVINFFKKYEVDNSLGHYVYSLGITPENNYYLYVNYNVTTAGPESRVSLLKLDQKGEVLWHKIYNYFAWHYGFMIATSDGGALLNMALDLLKMGSDGKMEWMIQYDGRELFKAIETSNGFALSYFEGSGKRAPHLLMIEKDGSFRWNMNDFDIINARKGVLRNNGNLLLVGRLNNASNKYGFIEVDPGNGNILDLKSIDLNETRIDDLSEDSEGNIYFSGAIGNGLNSQIVLGKLNDSLSALSCNSTEFNYIPTYDSIIAQKLNTLQYVSNNTLAIDEVYTEKDILASSITTCSYYEQPNGPNLGNDTTICPSETIVLGDANNLYPAYKWSNGATTKTIEINEKGWYTLSVMSACDTLLDSIYINHFKDLDVKFESEPENVSTNDSIKFINKTIDGLNPVWDLGNGDILLKDSFVYSYSVSGYYAVSLTVLSSDNCPFTATKNIAVSPSDFFMPNVFSPNRDGVNDLFRPIGEDIESFDLAIYNRWGRQVFKSKSIPWNGFDRDGNKSNSEVYYYEIKLYFNNGLEKRLKGSFSLLGD